MNRHRCLRLAVLFATCSCAIASRDAAAQVRIIPGARRAIENATLRQERRRLFVTDRETTQRLQTARQLLAAGQTSQALALLQNILDRDEDFAFVDDESSGIQFQGSLKKLAERTLENLTANERRVYLLEYATAAEQALERGSTAGGAAALEEVTRRFFHTPAGAEAAYRLGTYYLDHSAPRAGAMVFDRLRRSSDRSQAFEPMLSLKAAVCWQLAGVPEQCVATLSDLKKSRRQNFMTLGGQQIAFFDNDDEALTWLATLVEALPEFYAVTPQQWSMFAGDSRRNAQNSDAAAMPVTAWSYPTLLLSTYYEPRDVESFERQLLALEDAHRESSFLTQPAAHPLLVNGITVFRSLSNVRAVDATDGRLLWESALLSGTFENLRRERRDRNRGVAAVGDSSLKSFLTQRSWRDLTTGTLSSDGKHVFSIEAPDDTSSPSVNAPGQPGVATPASNVLTALELSSGKLKWEMGGPRGDYELQQPGTFFLGPPLPHEGNLYCLTESSGEIRMLILDPETGELLWSQSLVQPASSLKQYVARQTAGLSPSTADGVIVCPTAAGAVIGIDSVRRMLSWGYVYDRNVPPVPQDRRAAVLPHSAEFFFGSNKDDEDRWTDSAVTIAAGRVVITPRDSDELHCLDLAEGTLLWKRPRGEGLYVGCAHDGHVLIVGKNEVRGIRIGDGSEAWAEPTPIPAPSGRGFRDGSLYRLPLSTGEMASLDIATGRVVGRTVVAGPDGIGNLISAGDRIVSQSVHEVVGYQTSGQIENQIEADLAKDAGDATVFARRGELLLHQGEEQAALEALRRGFELDDDGRCRDGLVATLTEGLRVEFPLYRDGAEQIEALIEEPSARRRFLQIYADGLAQSGDRLLAFSKYLQLATDPGLRDLAHSQPQGSLEVGTAYWTQPRLRKLYRAGTDEERAEMDRLCRERIEEFVEEDNAEGVQSLSIALADLPAGLELLLRKIDTEESDPLQTQFALQRLQTAGDASQVAQATAREAQMLIASGRADEAGDLLAALATEWSQTACLDGKTGRELLADWLADADVDRLLSGSETWPVESFQVQKSAVRSSVPNFQQVRLIGSRGFFGDGWTLLLDTSRWELSLRDGSGSVKWTLQPQRRDASYQYMSNRYAMVQGHLLTVVLGGRFYVFDLLAEGKPKLLWDKMLYGLPSDRSSDPRRATRWMGRRGFLSTLNRDPFGRPLGKVGPVTDEALYYQADTSLFAADPLTGEQLWERRNLPRGSDCFGDREYVFVVPPRTRNAIVLRAADGLDVGRRSLPPAKSRLATFGRHLLTWNSADTALALYDPFEERSIWERDFENGSQASVIGHDEVAVLEPDGRFTVLDARAAEPRVQAAVDPIKQLKQFVVLRSQTRYVLMSQGAPPDQPDRMTIPNPSLREVNGNAYGFDRATGRKIWTTAIGPQAFDPSQPGELPILTLAAQTFFPGPRSLVRKRPFSLLLLDKRTGEIIFKDESANPNARFQVIVDRERSTIEVVFYMFKVTLQVSEAKAAT